MLIISPFLSHLQGSTINNKPWICRRVSATWSVDTRVMQLDKCINRKMCDSISVSVGRCIIASLSLSLSLSFSFSLSFSLSLSLSISPLSRFRWIILSRRLWLAATHGPSRHCPRQSSYRRRRCRRLRRLRLLHCH